MNDALQHCLEQQPIALLGFGEGLRAFLDATLERGVNGANLFIRLLKSGDLEKTTAPPCGAWPSRSRNGLAFTASQRPSRRCVFRT